METFRIESTFNKANFIRAQLIKWEIHWLKNRRQLLNYSTASIIVLLVGIIIRTEEEPFNPFIFFGTLIFAFTIFLLIIRLTSKSQYLKEVKKLAEEFELKKLDYTFEFSNKSIKYWDQQMHLEFNWEVFSNYSTYKDYLILNLNYSLFDPFIFKKEESGLNDYNKILELVISKLEFKRIK